ncbi:hypothetical protein [Erwinia psidii]|uniref:hypothetical protein n=1 Tax=Erwinia psidii TaxID=69224 RepID=UPI000F534FCE|nr:hypothetical protein [Erwinia psidii]MCX8958781.1 hypothetical protein [Erwinia psidii]MCX8963061.1 hypothetical protein [Erwinia psidii]
MAQIAPDKRWKVMGNGVMSSANAVNLLWRQAAYALPFITLNSVDSDNEGLPQQDNTGLFFNQKIACSLLPGPGDFKHFINRRQ